MSKIYKIFIFVSLLATIFAVSNFVFAQGKGYFYEQGNNFFIPDNVQIYGYMVVENILSSKAGNIGDVIVENNMIIDQSSIVNFCQDLAANTDCSSKSMVWDSSKLDVVNNQLNEIQANRILALNKDIYLESARSIVATGTVNLQGCFSNDGSGTCRLPKTCVGGGNDGLSCDSNVNCPNGACNFVGELKTGNLYTNNLASMSSKTANNRPFVKISASKLNFNNLDLGTAANHSNVCYILNDPAAPCSPANLNLAVTLSDSADPRYTYLVADPRGKWNFGPYSAYIAKESAAGAPTKKLCCMLNSF